MIFPFTKQRMISRKYFIKKNKLLQREHSQKQSLIPFHHFIDTTFIKLLLVVVLLLGSKTAFAQVAANPDSALQVILGEIKGTSLSLKDAQEYAQKKSTSVQIAKASYLAAKGAVRRDAGYFDPEFFLSLNYENQKQPTSSFFAGANILNTKQTTYTGGFRMDLPIGTQLELSVNAVKLQTNSQFAFLNPEFNTLGSLSFRQPLLNGFTASARKQLTHSEQMLDAAKARYDQEMVTVNSQVELSYWNLYVAERDYAVQKLSRNQAEAFLKETELRAKAGLVGPDQVANAKTFLAQQEIQLLDREEQFDGQSDAFASLIGVRPEDKMKRFIPTDDPPAEYNVEDVEVLVERTLKNNLDLEAMQKEVDASRVLVDAAKWESLPRVDLIGSLSSNGLGGSAQNVIFGGDTLRATSKGSLGDALNQVFKREYPNWSIGVEVSVPIGMRSGLGEEDRLEAQYLSTQQRYIDLSRSLEEQVRSSYRELFNGKRRLEAAKNGVEAAQEQVRIGLIEFHNGRTTAFELVRLGADFASAQQQYSEALVRTAKAAASLKQLTSGGFTAKNIQ